MDGTAREFVRNEARKGDGGQPRFCAVMKRVPPQRRMSALPRIVETYVLPPTGPP